MTAEKDGWFYVGDVMCWLRARTCCDALRKLGEESVFVVEVAEGRAEFVEKCRAVDPVRDLPQKHSSETRAIAPQYSFISITPAGRRWKVRVCRT